MHLEKPHRAGGAQQQREMQVGGTGLAAQRLFQMRGVGLGELGRHMGRELDVLAELEDLLLHRLVCRAELAAGLYCNLARERALAVFQYNRSEEHTSELQS